MARKRKYRVLIEEDFGIYDTENVEEQCEDDMISGAEEGFMVGYLSA